MADQTHRRARPLPAPGRAPGRPRSEAARAAILDAAYELLEEAGIGAFTIEGVAARAGSAKTTIYRWWPSRGLLATEALLKRMAAEVPVVPSDSAIADLRRVMRALARLFSSPTGRVIAGLISEANACNETAVAVRRQLIERRREMGREILRRGMAAGELRPDIDFETVLDALFGPFYMRLMLRLPLTEAWSDSLMDLVLGGACRNR
jgi:AcrR family transcriptional regulator